MHHSRQEDIRNLTIAFVLCALIISVWQFLVVTPERQRAMEAAQIQQSRQAAVKEVEDSQEAIVPVESVAKEAAAVERTPRVKIRNERLHGSLSLKGLRFDKLTLANYKVSLDRDSAEVILLAPSSSENSYFAEIGWASSNAKLKVPGPETVWSADSKELTSDKPVNLSWDNGSGLVFKVKLEIDENYLFKFSYHVQNNSGEQAEIYPYGLISRSWIEHDALALVHEGPLGTFDNSLEYLNYEDLKEEGPKTFSNAKGWLGITDKYWLTSFIPESGKEFTGTAKYVSGFASDRYQVDYLGNPVSIASGQSADGSLLFFAGAKELKLLDKYSRDLGIPLFDRAVDLGSLYFLTKPIFTVLSFFYQLLGNFGLAILLLTVCIKILMFPLANKSFKGINAMKELQPQVKALQDRYKDDKMKMNKELMELYKREKVNPAAGCLPLLLQLPVFFALYKVLNVTIEMRHAPFYGWIHDLSAADPTNIFTLFGLLNWNPPENLHIGIWPIIMLATMLIQQTLQPKPSDPTQATVIKMMPWLFIVLFARFPAGLIIYWSWSNALSILQQLAISKMHKQPIGRKAHKAK